MANRASQLRWYYQIRCSNGSVHSKNFRTHEAASSALLALQKRYPDPLPWYVIRRHGTGK